MGRRTTLLYALLLLLPTLVIGGVLIRLLGHERERQERAGLLVAEEQARSVAGQIQVAMDGFQAEVMRKLAALPSADPSAWLRTWEKRDPLIRNVFLVAANGDVLLPGTTHGISTEEQSFLQRYAPLFSGRASWTPPPSDAASATSSSRVLMTQSLRSQASQPRSMEEAPAPLETGWLPWFAGRNLCLLAWAQRPGGIRYGVEIEMSSLLARLTPSFPKQAPPGQTLALLDGEGAVLYCVGETEFTPAMPIQAAVSLAPALPHWQVVVAGAQAAGSGRRLFSLLAAVLCGILVLTILGGGWLLLRDARRSQIEARTRSTFVAHVSHELRTPLTTIRMYADLLREGRARDEAKCARYLDIIGQETQRLTRLINNVLDFSRIEQGRKTYRPETLDLAAETRRIVDAQVERLRTAGLAVDCEGTGAAIPVRTDRDAFEQALLNVLDNAAKYGASGGRLLVRMERDASEGRVHVCDWGAGVPAAHRARLFQPFYRADDSLTARQPGCGLGLSISRRLLRDQGGDLSYAPAEHGGACFVLSLPFAETEPPTGTPT